MQKWFIFLCLFFSLVAKEKGPDPAVEEQLAPEESEKEVEESISSYWKFHHAAYTGYRRDRQDLQGMKVEGRNSVQVMVSSHAEFKDLVGYIRGSYAWLCNGKINSLNLGAGYEVDARGAINYRIHFYNRKNFGLSFLPGVGYRYASMMNATEGAKRVVSNNTHFSITSYPNPNHQDWFGPYADARLELRFFDLCEWYLSCQYHQPYLVSVSKMNVETYAAGTTTLTQTNSVLKAPCAHMLLGMTDIKFNYGTGWSFGANFEGASTWSHHALDRLKVKSETYGSPETTTRSTQRASLHWTFYAVSFMVVRTF